LLRCRFPIERMLRRLEEYSPSGWGSLPQPHPNHCYLPSSSGGTQPSFSPPTNRNGATGMSKHAITTDTKMGESIGFWKGCRPASVGCATCYSIVIQMPGYGYKHPTQVTVNKDYDKPRRFKTPSMVFVCPWSDFFLDDPVPNANRDEAWSIMRKYSQHIFWITTKREKNIAKMLPRDWPLPNVWLGVSTENQHWADKRMDALRQIPIHPDALRFVCAEPLLGPITFSGPSDLKDFGWVISGGERGNRKHPPRLDPQLDQWFLNLAAQCTNASVPFHLMQRGGISKCKCHASYGCRAIPPGPNGQTFEEFPPQVQIASP